MKRFLAIAALMVAATAHATPNTTAPKTDLQLFLLLNGTPTKIGTLVSAAGASITNAATATPFTIVYGHVYMVECSVAANVGLGTVASATMTSANYLPAVGVQPDRLFLVANGTSLVMIPTAGAAGNCAVFEMR